MLHVKKILFPTDLSACAERAYAYAAALAARFGAEVYALHVRPAGRPYAAEAAGSLLPFTAADVDEQLRLPEGRPGAPKPHQDVVEAESVTEAIVTYAKEHGIDLIVMGARGRSGLRLPRLGSVAQHVVRHASCPVLTVRQPLNRRGLRRILAPVDFSDPSRANLAAAMEVAGAWGAQLDVLHVIDGLHGTTAYGLLPTSPLAPEVAERWEAALRDFAEDTRGDEVAFRPHVHIGPAAPTIINVALQLQTDLIVISTHGRTGLRRALMGSVAERVIQHAPCAILTVKPFDNLTFEAEEEAAYEVEWSGADRRRPPSWPGRLRAETP